VAYLRGDMRDICFDGEFERALLLFTAFGYFEDEENYKVLQNVSRALVKGGLFCFDTINRDAYLKTFLPYSVVEKDNDLMVDMNSFDALTGRNYNKRIIIRNGVRKDAPFFVRLYNLTEIRDLLNRAGLTLCNVYENWDGKPFASTSFRMIMVAKKE
jgi:SAM-dependent methyltransferase